MGKEGLEINSERIPRCQAGLWGSSIFHLS